MGITKDYGLFCKMQKKKHPIGIKPIICLGVINLRWGIKTRFWYFAAYDTQCSVTCGEGQQTRDVICVGPASEHLAEQACSGLVRPPSTQACRRPACHTHITWHVTDYGLVRGEKFKSFVLWRKDVSIITQPLFPCVCSAPEAAVAVWGRGGSAALIQIWTRTPKPSVD